MWIFCSGMYCSGSILQYQIIAHLVEEFGLGKRLGWVEPENFSHLYKQYQSQPQTKVIKTDRCTELMLVELQQHRAKGVYIYRNILEVYISRMEQTSKSFQVLWYEGFLEDCLQHHHYWTNLPHILVLEYELMTHNLSQEVQRIAHHLEIELNTHQRDKIAQIFSNKQKVKEIEIYKNNFLSEKQFLKIDQSIFAHYDSPTSLHTQPIRLLKKDTKKAKLTLEQIHKIQETVQFWVTKYQLQGLDFLVL